MDEAQEELLERYVDAFERYDMDSLTSLLHADATWSMPPHELWLQTHQDIRRWCMGPGIQCRGSRLVRVHANGSAAFAQYRPSRSGRGYSAWSLQVLELTGNEITGICFFLDAPKIFPLFNLPLELGSKAAV
jgi:RNA polymerase sigma-70 factor (ECF subfamily)